MKKSVEQMCRDLLTQAIKDRLVNHVGMWQINDPQNRSSSDLAGMSNLLNEFFHEAVNGSTVMVDTEEEV